MSGCEKCGSEKMAVRVSAELTYALVRDDGGDWMVDCRIDTESLTDSGDELYVCLACGIEQEAPGAVIW